MNVSELTDYEFIVLFKAFIKEAIRRKVDMTWLALLDKEKAE